ncbi:TPA: hypothetical protein I9092_003172 [Clostridium perfringens]|uniref:Uncharacterized protein n=1 Tax=Clostridium perfringens TaxID=1502 RepID=A0ABD4PYL8_CLOPF|nr:hypothetical protein [Clostridium perfringens]MBO3304390.1 hypothetical protein [Clostridium perfringens]MBO3311039.1 hypothetical protein [Clostridium perfringens]MBO3317344.1 hypothetical protein [Clostridium perfringens]MBO3323684.1 hypothetical protein [Clostridium perfringens]MBO3339024.1 hypothetical protein [Clostridium perfringens]
MDALKKRDIPIPIVYAGDVKSFIDELNNKLNINPNIAGNRIIPKKTLIIGKKISLGFELILILFT